MKILLITTYFEPDSGAAAVRLSRLAHILHKRGHEVTVLTTMPHYPQGRIADGYRGKFATVENRDGVRVIRTWLYATPSSSILRRLISQNSFMITAFVRGLGIKSPDVVMIESQPVFTSVAGVLLSKFKRVPYVMNVSDVWPEYLLAVGVMKSSHPLYRIFKWLVNVTQRGASGIVGLYPYILESIRERIGDGDNRRVIFNAVDLERFRPDLDVADFLAEHGLGDEKLVVFGGTFSTMIDFDTLLDVAAEFNDNQDVRFVFVGTGGQRDKVEARLAKGDLTRTKWIGWLNHQDMPAVWSAAHVSFWAIRNHPIYRTIIQAKIYETMASGTPVAIAVEGITTDLVTESGAGLTVPFEDQAALTGAIRRLLNDDDFHAKCAANARQYAETHFDPERVADAYEAVLTQAAKSGNR